MAKNNVPQISIIIPTMQKDIDVLNKLVAELADDNSIGEILIIDNSLKGYSYPSEKVRVYIPKKNLFVNPSWNYGIKNAKFNILGILNDDLILPKNLCSQILDFIEQTDNCGLIGLDSTKIIATPKENFDSYPEDCILNCQEINNTYCTSHWGAAIFGRKERFTPIPEKIKIWCGDNWLLKQNIDNNYTSYEIKSAEIKHLGSLTCSAEHLSSIKLNDIYEYAKYDPSYLKHPLYRKKETLLQKIFSVRNDKRGHKVLTILGLRLKIKRHFLAGTLMGYKHLLSTNVRPNSILMVEINNAHGEVLVGMAKYFLDLGFNIDILLSAKEKSFNPLARINDSRIRTFEMLPYGAKTILANKKTKKYEYIYFNSELCYDFKKKTAKQFFKKIAIPDNKILQMCHRLEWEETFNTKDLNFVMLADLPIAREIKPKTVNTHYFGEIDCKEKNKTVNFIVVGNIQSARKNFDLLINTVNQLISSGIKNFKITIVSRTGTLENIPSDIKSYFDFKGSLNYPDMYNEMESADFFLPLLDPDNPEHDRYITTGTSGSFQLIYGFLKPCIIHEKFARIHHFNSKNSIIYTQNQDFAQKMKEAALLSNEEYDSMRQELKILSNELYNKSLNNLKEITQVK